MLKYLGLVIGIMSFASSCERLDKAEEAAKMKMTVKMQEKVRKVSADLKAYCDSEIYRSARWKADSILSERRLVRVK